MATWLTVMFVVAAAVLLVGVGTWVGGVNADRKHLKQDAARDRKAFAEATKEIRRDIREILRRLPPALVPGSSPLQLTDRGIEEACFEYVEPEGALTAPAPQRSCHRLGSAPHAAVQVRTPRP